MLSFLNLSHLKTEGATPENLVKCCTYVLCLVFPSSYMTSHYQEEKSPRNIFLMLHYVCQVVTCTHANFIQNQVLIYRGICLFPEWKLTLSRLCNLQNYDGAQGTACFMGCKLNNSNTFPKQVAGL